MLPNQGTGEKGIRLNLIFFKKKRGFGENGAAREERMAIPVYCEKPGET